MSFKKILLFIISFSMLMLCSCQIQKGTQSTEKETTVVVHNESDEIYGILFEYCIDSTRLGGQIISKDPEMTAPMPQDKSYVSFS